MLVWHVETTLLNFYYFLVNWHSDKKRHTEAGRAICTGGLLKNELCHNKMCLKIVVVVIHVPKAVLAGRATVKAAEYNFESDKDILKRHIFSWHNSNVQNLTFLLYGSKGMAQLHCLTFLNIFHSMATDLSSARRLSTHKLSTDIEEPRKNMRNVWVFRNFVKKYVVYVVCTILLEGEVFYVDVCTVTCAFYCQSQIDIE